MAGGTRARPIVGVKSLQAILHHERPFGRVCSHLRAYMSYAIQLNREGHMSEKITITVSEMAARTGLSRTFLFSEIKEGRLKSLKIGKHRLIQTRDVTAYLDYYDNHRTAA